MGQARAVKSIARAAGRLLLSPRGWIRPLAGLGGEGSCWLSSRLCQLTKAEGIRFPLPIPPLSAALCSGRSKVRAWRGGCFGGQQGLGWAGWGSTGSVFPLLLVIPHGRNARASTGLARHFGWSVAAPRAGSIL